MSYKTCSILDCINVVHALELCSKHYACYKRNGDPIVRKRADNGGAAKHPNYSSFIKMKLRCYNEKNNRFYSHGARGIKVCERWLEINGFWNFVEDMGVKSSKASSLDRIDNDGNYSKENCRWATPHQQSSNRRSNNEVVGVCWHTHAKKWVAQIMVNRKRYYLGTFAEYDEAVSARKDAERLYGV